MSIPVNFCSQCGSKTEDIIPPGDQKPRAVCTECSTIHYQNPKIIAGCLIEHDDRILLCQRGIEPQHGKWTLPAGFMENQETVLDGAKRESYEEACVQINDAELYAVYDIPHISQVYMIYRAKLAEPSFAPGDESLDVALFGRHEIPWTNLAFSVIRQVLIDYYTDKDKRQFSLKTGVITPAMKTLLNNIPEGF